MIFKVEKRKKRVDGVLKQSRCYYLRYRIGDMPSDKWVSLGVTDKGVAHSEAKKFILEKEREFAGLALPRQQVEARNIPVTKLLAEFIEEMKSRRRDPMSQIMKRRSRAAARSCASLLGVLAALPCASHAEGTSLTEITTPVVYSDGRPQKLRDGPLIKILRDNYLPAR